MRKLRRGTGVPFPVWLGELTDENKKMASFLIWREFWNDGFIQVQNITMICLD